MKKRILTLLLITVLSVGIIENVFADTDWNEYFADAKDLTELESLLDLAGDDSNTIDCIQAYSAKLSDLISEMISNEVENTVDVTADAIEDITTPSSEIETKNDSTIDIKNEPEIQETVLYDDNDVVITAKNLEYSKSKVSLKILIENNSDQDLDFTTSSSNHNGENFVNGYMLGSYVSETVKPGKKTSVNMNYSWDELNLCGIEKIAEISVDFLCKDEKGNEYFVTGPMLIRTEIADQYDYSKESLYSGLTDSNLSKKFSIEYLVNNFYGDDIFIINNAGLVRNSSGVEMAFFEVENISDEAHYFSINDVFMNDILLCNWRYTSDFISPGKKSVLSVRCDYLLDTAFWPMINIESVDDMMFSIVVYDKNYDSIYTTDPLKIIFADNPITVDISGEEIYNYDGIRIISKGIIDDPSKYSDNIHILLLVENHYGSNIRIDDEYNESSVNGYMFSIDCSARTPDDSYELMDVILRSWNFDDADIESIDDIEEVELVISVKDDNSNVIDKNASLIITK